MAYELLEPLAALISSSARHSAMVFTLRNAASRAPVVSSQIACGDVMIPDVIVSDHIQAGRDNKGSEG
jgi:hypothetical protein